MDFGFWTNNSSFPAFSPFLSKTIPRNSMKISYKTLIMILYLTSEFEFPVPLDGIKRFTIVFIVEANALNRKFSYELKMKTQNLHYALCRSRRTKLAFRTKNVLFNFVVLLFSSSFSTVSIGKARSASQFIVFEPYSMFNAIVIWQLIKNYKWTKIIAVSVL